MSRTLADRPGLVIFPGGIACLMVTVALGFYLAHEAQVRVFRPESTSSLSYEDRLDGLRIGPDQVILSNVNALMWMVFGLGACLTLLGLRLLTRPNVDFAPSKPIGSIRNVFENPE